MTLGRLEKWIQEEGTEIDYYKRLLRKSPTRYVLLDFLADALYKQAEYEEAIHCWKKLLNRLELKESFHIFMKIAQSYEALGELEFAYHFYNKAVEMNKASIEAIGKFGQIAYLIENYEDALKAFQVVTANDPYNAVAFHNLGLSYYNLGYHDEALDCLEMSLSIDEESADTWYSLAAIYAENYLTDDALFSLERALTLDPSLRKEAEREQSFYPLTEFSLFKMLLFYSVD